MKLCLCRGGSGCAATQVCNTSRAGDSTASQGSLCQSLAALKSGSLWLGVQEPGQALALGCFHLALKQLEAGQEVPAFAQLCCKTGQKLPLEVLVAAACTDTAWARSLGTPLQQSPSPAWLLSAGLHAGQPMPGSPRLAGVSPSAPLCWCCQQEDIGQEIIWVFDIGQEIIWVFL